MFFNKMKTEEPDSQDQVAGKIVTLMEKAEKCVWISSGFNPGFYNSPNVKKAIEEAFTRVDKVRVLVHGDADSFKKNVPWLVDLTKTNKNIEMRCSNPLENKVNHWVIVDKKHFRLEKEHAIDVIGNQNLFVTDMDPAITDLLIPRFEKWWNEAESLDP